ELVVHLDGLPLAIELAAARTAVLSPPMILERLGQRLSLLRWVAPDLPARQRTLAAALAWSYELLDESERVLFRRLGVFAGGFTLEAGEALLASTDLGDVEVDVVDGLTALVANSLVVSEPDGAGGRRYRLLESMRDYALARLAERGEEATARRAHVAYYVAFAERAEPELRAPGQRTWLRKLEQEQQNLHAALQWLADQAAGELELRLATAAGAFWSLHGNVAESRRWLEGALRRAPDVDAHLRLRALVALGRLLSQHGAAEVEQARTILTEALTQARAVGAARSVAEALNFLGVCDLYAGALAAATDRFERGLAAAREAEDSWQAAFAHMFLGAAVYLQGQSQRATPWLEDAVREFRILGDAAMIALALTFLGAAHDEAGDRPQAVAGFRESLEISAQLEYAWLLHRSGQRLALLYGDAVDAEPLAELVGALEALQRTRGLGPTVEEPRREPLAATLRARLGAQQFAAALERGRAHSFEQTVALIRQLLDGLPLAVPSERPDAVPAAAGAHDPLSPRERAVLRLVADGLSNKEIADRLSVSERTAKHHVTALFNKLGVTTRAQAVATAAERGLLVGTPRS
ncbi:MAG: LuxR C-terminal-related transcriptional regulator, partial [Dehalococcoidia bacterium]